MNAVVQTRLGPRLVSHLQPRVGRIIAEVVVEKSCARCGLSVGHIESDDLPRLLQELEKHLGIFVKDIVARRQCIDTLSTFRGMDVSNESVPDMVISLSTNSDVMDARDIARDMVERLGFLPGDQIKLVTVVSEFARNVVMYAGSGRLTLRARTSPRVGIEVIVEDQGPGIPNLEAVMAGEHRSRTGMGLGLRGSKRVMHEMDITTEPGRGTRIVAVMYRT